MIHYSLCRSKDGDVDKVYVTGCLSERYKSVSKEIPEVDAFWNERAARLVNTKG